MSSMRFMSSGLMGQARKGSIFLLVRSFGMVLFVMALLLVFSGGCDGDKSNNGEDPVDAGGNDGGNDGRDGSVAMDGGDVDGGDIDPNQLLSIDDFDYTGAYRLSSAEFGESNLNYAVGTLAYNPERHSLFIVGHAHHDGVAEFAIPTPVKGETLEELPVVEQPEQDFVRFLNAVPNGNPDSLDRITGMLVVEGQLIINAEKWYDASGSAQDTTLVVREADNLTASPVDGYFQMEGRATAAGYMAPIPSHWEPAFGGTHLTGWASNYSIISRYSVGPSLFVFDPDEILDTPPITEGPISTQKFMAFPHSTGDYLAADALETQEGSASPLWNFLSRAVYGVIIPGSRTFAVFGSSGGVHSGIGYKITQDNDNLCGGYCAYQSDDYYNYYWFFDLQDILDATEPHAIQPYAYGAWEVPFDNNGSHSIIGGAYDFDSRVLYLALANAGRVGEYDRPPLIVTFATP